MNGWFVEVVRDAPFENILIGPFVDEAAAIAHAQGSDVEDWCYGEAKAKGYTVDDVLIVHNPTLIPSYGVNAPVLPVYQTDAVLGILPGSDS